MTGSETSCHWLTMREQEGVEIPLRVRQTVEKESAMPTYEYTCKQCGERFELILSFGEHEKKHKCPKCGSTELEQRISPFVAVTSKKA